MKYAILLATLAITAQPTGVTINTPWGTRTHYPMALERAVDQQVENSCAARPDSCQFPLDIMSNRRQAAIADVKLAEVVTVSIDHDTDGNVIINLVDVDGNASSIWTSTKELKNQKTMPVTGVEPY